MQFPAAMDGILGAMESVSTTALGLYARLAELQRVLGAEGEGEVRAIHAQLEVSCAATTWGFPAKAV